MDESTQSQNRRDRRSNVLMQATLELSATKLDVKLRNLSSDGALIEGDKLPIEGAHIVFRKGDLAVAGTVVWTKGRRAGLSFTRPLSPATLLRHVPPPRARVKLSFRRPGLQTRGLSADERAWAELWLHTSPVPPLGD